MAALVDAGLPVVVAAGNSDINACTESPGREPKVLQRCKSDEKPLKFNGDFNRDLAIQCGTLASGRFHLWGFQRCISCVS